MNSMLVIFIQSADHHGCDDIKNNIESNLKENDFHVERIGSGSKCLSFGLYSKFSLLDFIQNYF